MPVSRSVAFGTALAIASLAGLAACSDEDKAAPFPAVGSPGDPGATGAQEAIVDAMGGATGSPFGTDVDDETIAMAMRAATGADRVEVDGSTFLLHFDEGSKEDVGARVNCSAMTMLKAPESTIVMSYPDGPLDCAEALQQ